MLENQPTKHFILVDPYLKDGILLAKKLLSIGYYVSVIGDTANSEVDVISTRQSSNNDLEILDIKNGCINNIIPNNDLKFSKKFYVLNTLKSVNSIFTVPNTKENNALFAEFIHGIKRFAIENQIEICYNKIHHCELSFIEEIIDYLNSFFKNNEKRLMVNSLDIVWFVGGKNMFIDEIVKDILDSNSDADNFSNRITFRDLLKIYFEVLGAELEFCGKGEQERGVIVDYAEEILSLHGLGSQKIRLGNTVLKINDLHDSSLFEKLKGQNLNSLDSNLSAELEGKIKRLIKKKIYNNM